MQKWRTNIWLRNDLHRAFIKVCHSDVYSHLFIYAQMYIYHINPQHTLSVWSDIVCVYFHWQPCLPWQRRNKGLLMTPKTCLPPPSVSIWPASHHGMLVYNVPISWFAYLCRQAMCRSWARGNMCICVLCSVKYIQYLPFLLQSLINCAHRTVVR